MAVTKTAKKLTSDAATPTSKTASRTVHQTAGTSTISKSKDNPVKRKRRNKRENPPKKALKDDILESLSFPASSESESESDKEEHAVRPTKRARPPVVEDAADSDSSDGIEEVNPEYKKALESLG